MSAPGTLRSTPRWRRVTAVLVVVLGCLLAPLSLVAAWGRTALTDTDAVVAMVGPLASDAVVQDYVVDQVVAAIEGRIDLGALTDAAAEAAADRGLSESATDRVRALQDPANARLLALVRTVTEQIVTSRQFATLWTGLVRTTHTQVAGALADDPTVLLALGDDGKVGVQLGPVVAAVKAQLLDLGVSAASAIPQVDRTIVITQSDDLTSLRPLYRLVVDLGTWLPWVALALLLAGVALAARRVRTLAWTSLALALTLGALLLVLWVGTRIAAGSLDPTVPSRVVRTVVDGLVGGLERSAWTVAIVAAAVAAAAGIVSSDLLAWRGPTLRRRAVAAPAGAAASTSRDR